MNDHPDENPDRSPKFAYSIRDLMRLTSLGRTRIYQEKREGRLIGTKCGRRTIYTGDNVHKWLRLLSTSGN